MEAGQDAMLYTRFSHWSNVLVVQCWPVDARAATRSIGTGVHNLIMLARLSDNTAATTRLKRLLLGLSYSTMDGKFAEVYVVRDSWPRIVGRLLTNWFAFWVVAAI